MSTPARWLIAISIFLLALALEAYLIVALPPWHRVPDNFFYQFMMVSMGLGFAPIFILIALVPVFVALLLLPPGIPAGVFWLLSKPKPRPTSTRAQQIGGTFPDTVPIDK